MYKKNKAAQMTGRPHQIISSSYCSGYKPLKQFNILVTNYSPKERINGIATLVG